MSKDKPLTIMIEIPYELLEVFSEHVKQSKKRSVFFELSKPEDPVILTINDLCNIYKAYLRRLEMKEIRVKIHEL